MSETKQQTAPKSSPNKNRKRQGPPKSSKKKPSDINESRLSKKQDLVKCKHCSTKITPGDFEETMKQPLEEKWGIHGGVEKPYIQLYNVVCPSKKCGKKYTVKLRKANWFYN